MGGYGSGRRWLVRTKGTVEGLKSLDINWLNRNGLLQQGAIRSVSWSRNGKPSGDIVLHAQSDRIVLTYRYRRQDGDWQDVEEPITLTWTSCNFGGFRPWFVCPGLSCGRRVGKLYAAGRYFLCRHCHDLAYECQRENRMDRMLRKAQDIRARLGGSRSIYELFPFKPKGMHWKTYHRLRNCAQCAERNMWLATAAFLDKLKTKLPPAMRTARKNKSRS